MLIASMIWMITVMSFSNIFDVLPQFGNEDMVIEVCSTSKITFPGAGVSALIASDNNIAAIKSV